MFSFVNVELACNETLSSNDNNYKQRSSESTMDMDSTWRMCPLLTIFTTHPIVAAFSLTHYPSFGQWTLSNFKPFILWVITMA